MQRLTRNDLDKLVQRLNTIAGAPQVPYVDGVAQIGHYMVERAYGGNKLVQIVSESGAARDVCYTGFVSTRTLYNAVVAFIKGFEKGREVTETAMAEA